MNDDLERFVDAQASIYPQVLAELAAGDKRSHWMWFVFPQLRALGRSSMARHYGLESLAHAQAYLTHPVLGPRLKECVDIVLGVRGRSAHEIFHSPDDLKFCSCLTLFEAAALVEPSAAPAFALALDRFFAGRRDPMTLSLLA